MKPELNVPNLDKLIAHLEAQPPERINMGWVDVAPHPCGTCGCIKGHAELIWPDWTGRGDYGLDNIGPEPRSWWDELVKPPGWSSERNGVVRYPAHRVIATLKRLRDRFLVTGEIVVDWGPEPTAGEPWSAPKAVEITPPALPEEITRLLAPKGIERVEG